MAGSNFDLELYTDTYQNSVVDTILALNYTGSPYVFDKLRLVLSVVEYSELISETIRKAYKNTFTIPCVFIQSYTQNLNTGSTAPQNFTWPITATLKNAKGKLFTFRPAVVSIQSQYSLSARSSLGITKVN